MEFAEKEIQIPETRSRNSSKIIQSQVFTVFVFSGRIGCREVVFCVFFGGRIGCREGPRQRKDQNRVEILI
jgi:hypothetical protein